MENEIMSVRDVDWDTLTFKMIETKYGEMLSYHIPKFHEQYAKLEVHPIINQTLETKQYDIFIDIGAYVGLFTVMGSFNCKKVIAYEAAPFIFGILLYNTKYLKNVECRYAWVGNKESIPQIERGLYMVKRRSSIEWGSTEYNIPVVELDNEILPLVNSDNRILIKMDIEGNEYKALKGCTLLIDKPQVHWIIEIHEIKKLNLNINEILKYFKNRDVHIIGNEFIYVKGIK